ncbi:AMP-binding protein [Iamia majanohamensis]|uniref:AMP-binding protein n=1 Tax=Iamia majanohamensis TaxID=467976 RepID=A0AAE9Y5C2_9ACTN|nr:AMP-binding protein [Iamia majanohamensis]WCO66784.1 AMP-binding protein [Iamia majanohamensis]
MGVTIDDAGRTGPTPSERLRDLARTDPDRVAVVEGGVVTGYAELDRRVDALAATLVARLGPGRHRIALRLDGTGSVLVASMAVLRAGGVSVPVDPTAPPDRVRLVLDDVEPAVLLSDVVGDPDAGYGVPVLDPASDLPPAPAPVVPPEVPADEPIAVLFTSGSTGVPKGIMVSPEQRRQVEALCRSSFPEGLRVGVLSVGTVGFTEALLQAILLTGGTIVAYDIRRLGLGPMPDWLDDERIEAMATVPTVLRFLLPTIDEGRTFPRLGIVVMAGEAPTWEDVAGLRRHLPAGAVVQNSYGTTETGSISTFDVGADDALGRGLLPAGRPVPGVEVEVVDEDGHAVATGRTGEVVVTGAGVGLGYWRRPDLTRSTWEDLGDGRRRCRTGDAGHLDADGVLHVEGRLDHVVKVSGHRVELGDVEAAVRAAPGVADGAVRPHTGPDGQVRLVAYVTAAPGTDVTHRSLRLALGRRLPPHMLPERTSVVAALPQLANGKVDRSALPDPATLPEDGEATDRPEGEREGALLDLWQRVLGRTDIGRHDDFWEVGGDSMRAVRLFAEIERELGPARPVSLLLEAPTVAQLAIALALPEDSLLVPVQVDGTRPPLFVVHAGAGGVLFARDLSRHLGRDQPVYGIRAPDLVDGRPPDPSIPALATRYLGQVREVWPDGPHHLAGLSFGGLVAFEMALQLQHDGGAVGLLGIGDSLPPGVVGLGPDGPVTDPQQLVRGSGPRARHRAGALLAMGVRRGVPEAVRVARRAATRAATRRRRPWWERQGRARSDVVLQAYGRLTLDYRPTGRFEGQALVVRSTRRVPGPPGHDVGWAPHTTDGVEVLDLDAPHDRLFNDPHAAEVAAAFTRRMQVAVAPS